MSNFPEQASSSPEQPPLMDRFTVDIPCDADPARVDELRRLTEGFGWRMEAPVDNGIPDVQFLEVSMCLYDGDELPGRNALGILALQRERFTGFARMVHKWSQMNVSWEYIGPGSDAISIPPLRPSQAVSPVLEAEVFADIVRRRVEELRPPFEMAYNNTNQETQQTPGVPMYYQPRYVTLAALRRYSQTYEDHSLRRGALPKALNVLLETAGITAPNLPHDEDALHFITPAVLKEELAPFVRSSNVVGVFRKINEALAHQFREGRSFPSGPVVIEGDFLVGKKRDGFQYQQVAIESLLNVAGLYGNHAKARSADGLRDYVAQKLAS